jgi:hypothetical protein
MRVAWLIGLVVGAGCTDGGTADRCVAPTGLGRPTSIAAAVRLLDQLPRPVTVPCVLESLDRPLGIEATYSVFSAQPSAGRDAPRIFVMSWPLSLSVVPAGDGRSLLEFGEHTVDSRTLKGELELPLFDSVAPDAPFERIRLPEGGTTCGGCHVEEDEVEGLSGAFDSEALAPVLSSIVDVEDLRDSAASCDPDDDACAVLRAVFDHGVVERQPFPEHFATLDGR